MPRKPNVEILRNDKDLQGLLDALRFPGSPSVRAQAAQALGQLNNSLAVESLIRSSRLDPESVVQGAARQALQEMFGTNAPNVIQAYPIYPDEAPWIVGSTPGTSQEEAVFEDDAGEDEVPGEEDKDQDEEDLHEEETETGDEAEGGWRTDDLGPLVTILRSERDPRLRLRAAGALGQLGTTNIHAVEALAATALWGDKPSVRAAALQALVKIYGDEETEKLLQTFREMQSLQVDPQSVFNADQGEEEMEEESEKDTAIRWTRQSQGLPQPISYHNHVPVMRDEGAGHLRQVVWIGIILLVIFGLVVIITYFK